LARSGCEAAAPFGGWSRLTARRAPNTFLDMGHPIPGQPSSAIAVDPDVTRTAASARPIATCALRLVLVHPVAPQRQGNALRSGREPPLGGVPGRSQALLSTSCVQSREQSGQPVVRLVMSGQASRLPTRAPASPARSCLSPIMYRRRARSPASAESRFRPGFRMSYLPGKGLYQATQISHRCPVAPVGRRRTHIRSPQREMNWSVTS